MAVCAYAKAAGAYKSFFGEKCMLYTHLSHIKEILYIIFISKASYLSTLLSRLDILVRCKMVHYHCNFCIIKNCACISVIKYIYSYGRSNIIA